MPSLTNLNFPRSQNASSRAFTPGKLDRFGAGGRQKPTINFRASSLFTAMTSVHAARMYRHSSRREAAHVATHERGGYKKDPDTITTKE